MTDFTYSISALTAACKAIQIGRTDIINGFIVRRLDLDTWAVVSPDTLEDAWSMYLSGIVSYILSGQEGEA